ncbi:LSU ribosomal protein L9P [Magnetococcus marinus MC-1]|uniref:Large ribosomal subunit protein bL9 n=1 Tax=Magnetococcus marinus (strain ATCC BAA-1437 / JCM 17883 / MC-1) TaxID=156889 RepID=RL9_MAGMM|nr:50S ribosomal protein L9 [Magnetococcus marinus]A0LAG5.1 RecName: Full=Large ribosomal subunit protein bL9; AltName: Full=50S ribosomal protein L9 [Magnetococcus marinus MC-1]ABK44958.1 LSU ribosomal protein L9P [Magnetococcus marinus MC-1]
MEVILLEKIGKIGNLGEVVKVRSGYGRNFLIPQGKALPATSENKSVFEAQRADYEARQAEILADAETLAAKVDEVSVVMKRPAGAMDKLFGSVTSADIAVFYKDLGLNIPRNIIDVLTPIRTLGEHQVRVRLHPDVVRVISIQVERAVK